MQILGSSTISRTFERRQEQSSIDRLGWIVMYKQMYTGFLEELQRGHRQPKTRRLQRPHVRYPSGSGGYINEIRRFKARFLSRWLRNEARRFVVERIRTTSIRVAASSRSLNRISSVRQGKTVSDRCHRLPGTSCLRPFTVRIVVSPWSQA